jgi:heat shock protein HtpX
MFEEIAANKRRSFALLAGFVVVLAAAMWAIGALIGFGWPIAVAAIVIAAVSAALAYWKSDAIALAAARAQPASRDRYPRLFNLVEGLCIAGGIPMPRIYVVEDEAPNAFATGRDPEHAAIAVTTGLLERMNRVELEAVLAHELSHVRNYDILVTTLAVTLVGSVALITDFGLRALWWGGLTGGRRRDGDRDGAGAPWLALVGLVFLILAPLVAKLMQFALSRRRESLADFSAVELTRYPPGLVSALEKLRDDSTVVRAHSHAMAHLWIESPLDRDEGHRGSRLNRLFDTHPPLDERIAALKEL